MHVYTYNYTHANLCTRKDCAIHAVLHPSVCLRDLSRPECVSLPWKSKLLPECGANGTNIKNTWHSEFQQQYFSCGTNFLACFLLTFFSGKCSRQAYSGLKVLTLELILLFLCDASTTQRPGHWKISQVLAITGQVGESHAQPSSPFIFKSGGFSLGFNKAVLCY